MTTKKKEQDKEQQQQLRKKLKTAMLAVKYTVWQDVNSVLAATYQGPQPIERQYQARKDQDEKKPHGILVPQKIYVAITEPLIQVI